MESVTTCTYRVSLSSRVLDRGWRDVFRGVADAHDVTMDLPTLKHGIFRTTFLLTLEGTEDGVKSVVAAFTNAGMKFNN